MHPDPTSPTRRHAVPVPRTMTAVVWAFLLGTTVLGTALSGPGTARAAGLETEMPPGFAETVDVRLVELEAVVTRRGERVQGLTREDFELRVDGEPVEIELFSEVRDGAVVDGQAPNAGPLAGLRSMPTYFLLFVDDYFSLPNRRDQTLRSLKKQLTQLGPDDRLAVVAYDGKRVTTLTSWERDGERLNAALDAAAQRPAYGLQRRSEWRQTQDRRPRRPSSSDSSFAGIGFAGVTPSNPAQLELETDLAFKVSRVADAAASSLRAFAGAPGRRVMLLLSGGLPGLSAYGLPSRVGLFNNLERLEVAQDGRRLLRPIVEAANLLGFTLYPMDIGGLSSLSGTAEAGTIYQSRLQRRRLADEDFSLQDSLYFLADETGGLPVRRGGRHTVLRQVAEDTATYYSLAFSRPSRPGQDGKREDHLYRIELKVKSSGHRVRARRSFADLSRSTLLSFQVESAHQFDVPLPKAGPLDADLGALETVGVGWVQVPLTVRIPTRDLPLLPTADGLQARLELRVAASDGRGRRAEIGVVPVDITFADAGEVKDTAQWTTSLKLRKRDHRLLVVLYDPVGDTLLSKRLELDL